MRPGQNSRSFERRQSPHANVLADRYAPVLNNRQERRLATQWTVFPTRLPLIRRRCLRCSSAEFLTHGKFRVNANHRLLDVWLLALCAAGCGETVKLTVMERANVRTIDPSDLMRFHGNDPGLAADVLGDPMLLRRNGVTLDWGGAWTLRKAAADGSPAEVIDTSVRFARPIPIKVATLLAAGLEVSRSGVHRLAVAGRLSTPRRLTATVSGDFPFTLRLPATAGDPPGEPDRPSGSIPAGTVRR